MNFYSPSPLSLGYIPRGSYRPALSSTYLDDEFSSPLTFEGLGYPNHSHTFSPRLDAETRYRRAVHELQAAEEEFEAHLTLRRAREAAILRERAVRRERALAIQAEVERIERARALQAKLAEEYGLQQRAHQAQVALDRARRQKHAFLHSCADAYSRDPFAHERSCACAKKRLTHSEPVHRPVHHDSEVATFGDLLKLLSGTQPQPSSPLEQSDLPAPPQPRPVESQPPEKRDAAADAVSVLLEFIHGLTAHAKDDESETVSKVCLLIFHVLYVSDLTYVSQPSPVPQPQAVLADEKGKGKAKVEHTEPAAKPTFLQALLAALPQGPHAPDQELKDMELAIKLSLEERDAVLAKKAGAAKAVRSTSGASSSRVSSYFCPGPRQTANACMQVKLDGAGLPRNTTSSASDSTSATAKPVRSPVSPLTTIRAVRNQLSTLESTFKFPAVLDFDQSVLAVSPNNAPLRAYETALNGLLEQLDAIVSDGDEEVRNTRREVVREVEKALEDLEHKVSEKAPKIQVTKDAEVKGYEVEAEELETTTPQDAVPVEATKPSAADSPAEVDLDLAIPEEHLPLLPAVDSSSSIIADSRNNGVAQGAEDLSSLEGDEPTSVLGDSQESVATITGASANGQSSDTYVPAPPGPESFLASMSHDHFTFPPKRSYSDSSANPAGVRDDAVLVENSEEGESVKSGEDGWSEVDA